MTEWKITLLELGLARDLSSLRSERQTIYQRHLNWLSIDMKYVIYWISASASRFSVILHIVKLIHESYLFLDNLAGLKEGRKATLKHKFVLYELLLRS